ncbi:tetratricopeptide repeat protein [Bradyrhizobium genosp. P]|uniref:tetratricopeptide repeat protein n=1 Tax=Bradyrhizobium genosp. P TaxID=83641 RepID=UPI003CE927D1
MTLIEKGDDFAARLELLNAIKYKSDKIEAWRALAGINERVKAYPYLFDNLRRIVELDPTDVEARTKLARMLLKGGAPDAALRVVETGGEAENTNPGLVSLKAAILMKMRDTSGGLTEAKKAKKLDPGDVEAAIILASDKLSKGDTVGALEILSVPEIAAKRDLRVDRTKALIFAQKGELTQAEAILHGLIANAPQDIGLHDLLFQIYVAERRFEDAEKELRAVAAANPQNPRAELDLVRFLGASKGSAAAREELNSRLKLGGDIFPYQMALADLNFNEGRFEESVATLEGLAKAPESERSLAAQAKLAEFYFRKSNFPAAEKIVDDILRRDPRNVAGLKIRASIRIEQGQYESAIADLREALNGQPRSPELLLLMGSAYERDGKLELADRQYADASKSAAGNPSVVFRYVAFLQRQGKTTQVEDVLTDALSTNPRSLELLSALGQVRLTRQDWKGALETADAMKAIGGDKGGADLIRGAAFAGQNNMNKAIAAFEAAHASVPDALQPVAALVGIFVRNGEADKAGALLRDSLTRNPDNLQLSLLMGRTQLAKKQVDQAEATFKTAIGQHPKDPAGYIALSNLYIGQKNFDEASKALQGGMREQPDSIDLRLNLGNVMIRMGDVDGAVAAYELILKNNPNVQLAVNNLASLLLDYRTDDESQDRAFSLAQNLKSSNVPQFEDTWGWAQYHHGDFKAAIATLEDAQGKLPNDASIRYHLGMAYISTGQNDKAAEQLKAALQLESIESTLSQKIRSALKQLT